MGGILKNIQKKGARGNTTVIKPSFLADSTQIVTIDQSLSDHSNILSGRMINDLKNESRSIVKRSQAETTQSQAYSSTKTMMRMRSIENEGKDNKNSRLIDDELPWWLNEPVKSSPNVDVLVPAARLALNDLLTEEIARSELPIVIRKAVNIAATRVADSVRLSTKDIEDAVEELLGLMLGKGPLQPLYDDPGVTDIFLDGHASIKCIRRGQALETPFQFRGPDEYEAYINTTLQSVERVLNMSSPIVDVVLEDQCRSRINAVHSSLLDRGESSVVIRIPRLQQVTFYDLLQTKTLPPTLAAWLAELVALGEANILVIGATGSGKTVFTTALLSCVGSNERIITIEDVPEIFVQSAHLEKLVARPENSQGSGSVGMEQLLRAALRRAPHRIVVGEIRDREGPLFLKALETGHAGSVATIHALHPKEGLWRLLDVVAAFESTPQESLQRRISRSLNILISMQRVNGRPCMIDISEVRPPINGEFVVQQLVHFEGEYEGQRMWRIVTQHSYWMDKLANRGIRLEPGPGLIPVDENSHEYHQEQD